MGRKSKTPYNPKRAAKFHRYAKPGMTGKGFFPEGERFPVDRPDPINTNMVVPLNGAATPERAAAEEYLPGSVQTLAGGFLSRPPKGKINQGVSTLTDHTKTVKRGTPSYRKAGPVKISHVEPTKGADFDQMHTNIGQGF